MAAHHDIARSRTAYAAFAVGTGLLSTTLLAVSFIRVDGLRIILRSYTAQELSAAVPAPWRVRTHLPARLELRWEAPHARP